MVRTPMPVQHFLSVAIPRPFDPPPQGVNPPGQFLLTGRPVDKILMGGKQSLSQKGRLNKVASVVLEAERFHPACLAIQPMRPSSMKPVGCLEKSQNPLKTLDSLFSGDIVALHSGDESHDAKSTAACRNDFIILLRVVSVDMDPFAGQSAVWSGAFPEIAECPTLDTVQKRLIGEPVYSAVTGRHKRYCSPHPCCHTHFHHLFFPFTHEFYWFSCSRNSACLTRSLAPPIWRSKTPGSHT